MCFEMNKNLESKQNRQLRCINDLKTILERVEKGPFRVKNNLRFFSFWIMWVTRLIFVKKIIFWILKSPKILTLLLKLYGKLLFIKKKRMKLFFVHQKVENKEFWILLNTNNVNVKWQIFKLGILLFRFLNFKLCIEKIYFQFFDKCYANI